MCSIDQGNGAAPAAYGSACCQTHQTAAAQLLPDLVVFSNAGIVCCSFESGSAQQAGQVSCLNQDDVHEQRLDLFDGLKIGQLFCSLAGCSCRDLGAARHVQLLCTVRYRRTTKAVAECILKHYRISWCSAVWRCLAAVMHEHANPCMGGSYSSIPSSPADKDPVCTPQPIG